MHIGKFAFLLTACLAAGPAPAFAQSASAQPAADNPPGTTIVVSGEKLDRAVVQREATEFVRQTGIAGQQESVARWVDKVCPQVVGVESKVAALVTERLKQVAQASGVPLARGKCQTNLAIVFTDDSTALVRDLLKREPRRFGNVQSSALAELTKPAWPVRWWYAHDVRSKDGNRQGSDASPTTTGASSSESGQAGASGGGSILPMDSETTTIPQYNSSIISTQAIRSITGATVLIDVNHTQAMPLDAVASYAALVALAEVRLGARPPKSILTLFEPGSTVRELTGRDQALLKALYNVQLDRKVRQQRAKMIGALIDAEMKGL